VHETGAADRGHACNLSSVVERETKTAASTWAEVYHHAVLPEERVAASANDLATLVNCEGFASSYTRKRPEIDENAILPQEGVGLTRWEGGGADDLAAVVDSSGICGAVPGIVPMSVMTPSCQTNA
jgi:hypothetical protein